MLHLNLQGNCLRISTLSIYNFFLYKENAFFRIYGYDPRCHNLFMSLYIDGHLLLIMHNVLYVDPA